MANTGYKAYTTLEQYNTATGVATGVTKPNTVGDPNYVAPVLDEAFCPVPSVTTWLAGGRYNSSGENYLKSTDGVSWSYSRIPTIYDVYNIAYLNGEWFALGSNVPTPDFTTETTIMKSSDSINWVEVAKPSQLTVVNSINYINGLYIASGRSVGGGTINTIATSPDLINWTGRGAVLDLNTMGINYANNIYIGYGESDSPSSGTFIYSTDGLNWTDSGFIYPEGAPAFGYDAFWNGSYWLGTGFKFGSNSQIIGKSFDGINWTPYNTGTTVNHTGRKLGYFNNLWVLGGRGSFEIATSTNGETWTGRLNGDLQDIRDFEYNSNKMIAVGIKDDAIGRIYSSTNATNWTEVVQTRLGLYTIAIRE